jgi:hypothetical protein
VIADQQTNPAIERGRYISPARTSQILGAALGHGYSRQSVLRLLEEGLLLGHQMKPRGRWWIESSSIRAYIAGLQNAEATQIGAESYSATVSAERPKGHLALRLPN